MIKCPNCGKSNVDNAVYCSSCGINILNYVKRRILLVEHIATSNFFLTKTFKKHGFDVKSLKTPGFVFDELSNKEYHFFVIDLDLSDKSNLGFLKTLKKLHPNQQTIIITPSVTKEELKLLKSLGFLSIFVKPVKVENILQHMEKNNDIQQRKNDFEMPIYNASKIEEILLSYIKDNDITYIISCLLKEFSRQNITSGPSTSLINRILHSTKRSDKLIILENIGFIIIPTEYIHDKGANILKNKIQALIDRNLLVSCGVVKFPYDNLRLSDICYMIINGKFEQKEKEITTTKKKTPHIERADQDTLLKDKHLVFSALNHIGDDDVAYLYLSEKFKKIVAPFITIAQANIIKKIKKTSKTEHAELKFMAALKKIKEINNSCRNDDIEKLIKSNISLMTLPEVQHNIIMLINEEASFKKIIEELYKDAAISSKVLKLVNSAFFGFSRQIKNLERAAAILGTEEILSISLSISYINSFDKNIKFIKKLWGENIAIMSIIKFIENKYKISTYSTSSILSSIGKIFFAQYFPEVYINTIKEAQKTNKIYDAVELKYFSIPHTIVGAAIIDMWNLPDRFKMLATYHTYPSVHSKLNTSLHLIHSAKYISGALGYSPTPQPMENMSYYTYTMLLKKHGIDVKSIYEEYGDELRKYVEDMMFLML